MRDVRPCSGDAGVGVRASRYSLTPRRAAELSPEIYLLHGRGHIEFVFQETRSEKAQPVGVARRGQNVVSRLRTHVFRELIECRTDKYC